MNRYKIILYIISLAISGCVVNRHSCQYDLTIDYIKTNCSLYNGLVIEKLKNVRKIEDGIPHVYDVEFKATYGGFGQAFENAMDDKLKKIVFRESVEGYKWIWHGKDIISPVMPFIFEANNWYRIGQLYENGAPSVLLFFYVKEDGSFQVTRKDSPTNW